MIAHQLKCIAAFNEALASCQETLEFDRGHFRAILPALGFALILFVAVEEPLDALGSAVEDVHRAPEQAFEIGLASRVVERGDQRIEDVGNGADQAVIIGQRTRVIAIVEGGAAVQTKFTEDGSGG